VGGAVAGSTDLVRRMRLEAGIHHGAVLSPFNAWLIARGLSTLPLRMTAHSRGAQAVAEWLEADPRVTRVIYPGLASHPQHDLARRQMSHFSGMLSFQVGDAETGRAMARRMIDRLEIVHYAVSLGHHRSLIFWMETEGLLTSSFRLTGAAAQAYRDWAGDGVFRLSVGLEDPADIIADLDRAL
jgi:methionine-gamma-lyase